MVFAIGVFGFDGNRLALVAGLDDVGVTGINQFAAGVPAVGDRPQAVFVFEVIARGQGLPHFRLAADGNFAHRQVVERVHRRLRVVRVGRFGHAVFHFARRGLVVPFFIGVGDVYADGLAFVARLDFVFFVGRARDFFAIRQPLVFDAVFRHAVFILDVRAQFLPDFGFATNFYAAGVVVPRIVVGNRHFPFVGARVAFAVVQDVFHRVGVTFGERR